MEWLKMLLGNLELDDHKHELVLTFPSAGPPGCTALTKSPESRAATKGDVKTKITKLKKHSMQYA
jgi:hypothetical protein